MAGSRLAPASRRILDHAANGHGVNSAEAGEYLRGCQHVSVRLCELVDRGYLARFVASKVMVRYYLPQDAAAGEAWLQAAQQQRAANAEAAAARRKEAQRRRDERKRQVKAAARAAVLPKRRKPAKPAPVVLEDRAERMRAAPMVVPPHVVVQRIPSPGHDPRYQCAPGERVAGAGFAAAGVGRYLETSHA